MPPVKKQKANKTKETNKKGDGVNADESVISGQLQKKIDKKLQKPKKDAKGVIFIKHLPHGFFEEQLKKYFEQFGDVSRVRLARSKRTGGSKGYAFVEFEYPEVAAVAAETMDNYLMFKKIVKATYIPPEKQQFNYFRTSVKKIRNKSGKIVWVSSKTASIQRKKNEHNDWSEDKFQKRTKKQLNKLNKLGEKYAHLGIDINKIIVAPKTLTEKEKKELEKSKAKAAKEEEASVSSKAAKRKTSKEDTVSGEQQRAKKSKKKISLEDLLGNTIQEDSEDEDYIAMPESQTESEETSDEETYGFATGSDEDETQAKKKSKKNVSLNDLLGNTLQEDSDDEDYLTNDKDDETSNGEEEESDVSEELDSAPIVVKKKPKGNFGKSLKSSNIERFDQMLKRKPHAGGIKKINKVPLKQPIVSKKKGILQLTAAKEVAKALSKVKGKKNIKKVK